MPRVASATLLLAYVSLQRFAELVIATRHTRSLVARGAYEAGSSHYPLMVALHASWLATLWLFGRDNALHPAFAGVFVVLQLGRFWVLGTLGERWTTRIMILPGAEPVTSGPFRFVRHPNYLVVAFELPVISLAVGLEWHAVVFGLLNLAMLAWRIRTEDAAFDRAGATAP